MQDLEETLQNVRETTELIRENPAVLIRGEDVIVAQNNALKYVRPLAIAIICSGCAQILGATRAPQRRFYDFGTEVVQRFSSV